MSYDLTFFRSIPGRSAEESYALMTDWYELGEEPSPDYQFQSRTLADVLMAAGLGLTEATFEDGIALEPAEDAELPLQILMTDTQMDITFPYWEMTPAREAALRKAWPAVMRATESFGLTGWDPQLDQEIERDNIEAMIASAKSTEEAIQAYLAKPKPWWKFW